MNDVQPRAAAFELREAGPRPVCDLLDELPVLPGEEPVEAAGTSDWLI